MHLLLFLFIAFFSLQCTQQNKPQIPDNLTATQEDSIKNVLQKEFPFRLESFIVIDSSDYILFPIELTNQFGQEKILSSGVYGGYDSKHGINNWNMLFYHTKTQEYHTLLEDTIGVFEHWQMFALHAPPKKEEEEAWDAEKYDYEGDFAAQYIFYSIRFDYDQDNDIDYIDPMQLYLTNRNGKNWTALTPPNSDLSNWRFYKKSHLLYIQTIMDTNENKKFGDKGDDTVIFEVNLQNPAMGREIFRRTFIKDLKDLFLEQTIF